MMTSGPLLAQAAAWQSAAECSALYLGHHAYEVEHFDAADVSDGWRVMASDFEAAARRLGATSADLDTIKAKAPGWQKAINANIFGGDPALDRAYQTQQRECERLIGTLPELAPHR